MQVYQFKGDFSSPPFIPLGVADNFGRCFEMVCFTSENEPQFALFYRFELQHAVPISIISYADAIACVKRTLQRYKKDPFSMYMRIMGYSATKVLQHLLEQYSSQQLRKKSVMKIERVWVHKCTCPYDPVCIRRLLREFHELQGDLVSHLEHRKRL